MLGGILFAEDPMGGVGVWSPRDEDEGERSLEGEGEATVDKEGESALNRPC